MHLGDVCTTAAHNLCACPHYPSLLVPTAAGGAAAAPAANDGAYQEVHAFPVDLADYPDVESAYDQPQFHQEAGYVFVRVQLANPLHALPVWLGHLLHA